jgi:hypothetical protein
VDPCYRRRHKLVRDPSSCSGEAQVGISRVELPMFWKSVLRPLPKFQHLSRVCTRMSLRVVLMDDTVFSAQ